MSLEKYCPVDSDRCTLRSEEAYNLLEDMKIRKVHWSDADHLLFLWNCSSQ